MPRYSARNKKAINYSESESNSNSNSNSKSKSKKQDPSSPPASPSATPKKRKADRDPEPQPTKQTPKAVKKARTSGKARKDDAMPLAHRTAASSLKRAVFIGAHVSAAGGVQNSVTNALQIGANSFALFLKSQRKWDNPPISAEAKDLFINQCKEHGYNVAQHAVPHGSYLVNLAQPDQEKASQAFKGFVDDLDRCEQLGIKLYNFHPGSTGGHPRPEAIGRIASQLNKAHKATKTVVTLLENMAGAGNVIGSSWEDLRDIIALIDDKTRVGVCIDTCHAFAAGYDMRTPEAFKKTIDSFNSVVGAKYLKAFHLNDSKAPFKSNRDLHENIGVGCLGLRAFHSVMNHGGFCNMPMVLETPIDKKGPDGKNVEDKQIWADEIKLLESLIDMDPESDQFKDMEKTLYAKGESERKRIQEQVDKKSQTGGAKRGSAGGAKRGKKAANSDDEKQ